MKHFLLDVQTDAALQATIPAQDVHVKPSAHNEPPEAIQDYQDIVIIDAGASFSSIQAITPLTYSILKGRKFSINAILQTHMDADTAVANWVRSMLAAFVTFPHFHDGSSFEWTCTVPDQWIEDIGAEVVFERHCNIKSVRTPAGWNNIPSEETIHVMLITN